MKSKERYSIYLLIAIVAVSIVGCPDLFDAKTEDAKTPTTPQEPSDSDTPSTIKYTKEFWGEWLRMDTGDKWYITSDTIKINDSSSSSTVTLTKQSNKVIEVNEGGRKYYLYASRVATAQITGRIASFAQGGRAIGGTGLGGMGVIIENLNDKTESKQTVTTDAQGNFTAGEIIPGDRYIVTPTGGNPTIVTPIGDGDDVGTIMVADGVNFKTSIKAAQASTDMTRLYADMNAYDLILEVENTGTIDCTIASYQLTFHNDLIPDSVPASSILGTIEPGKTRTIPLTLRCAAIQHEYEYKRIGITISDPVSDRSWEDSVSIRFHKAPVNFYIRSNNPISGVIIAPTSQAYPFTNVTSSTISMPWSTKDYLVVFSGATADTEAVYSFGIHETPDTNFNDFTGAGNYSNTSENSATPLAIGDKTMSYLYKNAIRYYSVNLGTIAPEIKPITMTDFAFTEAANGNDDKKVNPGESHYLDVLVRNTVNATISVASATLSTTSPYVTIDKGTGTLGDISAGNYKTLTDNTYSYSSASIADLLYSSYLSTKALKFTVSATCPIGTGLPFTVTFADSWGNLWTDSLTIPVVGTDAVISIHAPIADNIKVSEAANGNADGKVNPGETHYLDVRVVNSGASNALGVSAALATTSPYVTIDKGAGTIGDLIAGNYKTFTDNAYSSPSAYAPLLLYYTYISIKAFKFTVSAACPIGTELPFTVTFTDSWGNVWTSALVITVE